MATASTSAATTKSMTEIMAELKVAKLRFNKEIKKIDQEQVELLNRVIDRLDHQQIAKITNHLTSAD